MAAYLQSAPNKARVRTYIYSAANFKALISFPYVMPNSLVRVLHMISRKPKGQSQLADEGQYQLTRVSISWPRFCAYLLLSVDWEKIRNSFRENGDIPTGVPDDSLGQFPVSLKWEKSTNMGRAS